MTELRVGIAGAGLIGGVHARAYAATPGARLVAVADPVPGKADRLAAETGAELASSLDELLAADLDILSVCTPTPTHATLAIRGLGAGLSVMCEKPLARTLEDGRRILSAADTSTGLLSVGHVTRFEPDHAQAQQVIAAGALGELTMLSHSVTTSLPGWSQHGWLADHDLSGGPILDLAVHAFDFLCWVTTSDVVRVHTIGADTAAGPATYALVQLRFDNGAIGLVETSWAHPPTHGFKLSSEIIGTAGRLSWSYDTIAGGFLHRLDGETARYDPLGELGFAAEIGAFVHAVREGGPAPVSGREAFRALRISLAALESLRTGSTIDLTSWELP